MKQNTMARRAPALILVALLVAACAPAASQTLPTSSTSTATPVPGPSQPASQPPPKPPAPPTATPSEPADASPGDPPSLSTNQFSGCDMSSWTWPLCEIRRPTRPRINGNGRPDLTAKSSAWCRATYIQATSSGYTYWALVENQKIVKRFWPDYWTRYYQAMYWNGSSWQWITYAAEGYPNVIVGQRVYCDA